MPLFAKLIPFRDYIYLAAFVALIAFGVYERFHLINEGKAHELAALYKSSIKVQADADAKVAALTAQHVQDVAAIQETYDKQHEIDSAQHDSDAQRLRDFDTYRRARASVGSAPSGQGTQTGGSDSASNADNLLRSLEQVGLQLAAANRAAKNSLTSCMIERDSLTGK